MNWLRAKLLLLFSGDDNTTPEIVRLIAGLLALAGGIEFLFLAVWNVVVNKVAFEQAGFGNGLGLVIAALGAAVAAKAWTERK